jgi:hypothetical protein
MLRRSHYLYLSKREGRGRRGEGERGIRGSGEGKKRICTTLCANCTTLWRTSGRRESDEEQADAHGYNMIFEWGANL